eukprot:CAMPEP_0117549986 /NCGR_PEP_ID=MMETSP0784-20121206/48448_1 /TAXON_ID=39447 /ORGANISM="" /LENGTH=49 /DNA_ID=CAMNT_0005346991 /DNA_START=555 /DNA_END=704 /DNA_ORIENTATION=-
MAAHGPDIQAKTIPLGHMHAVQAYRVTADVQPTEVVNEEGRVSTSLGIS